MHVLAFHDAGLCVKRGHIEPRRSYIIVVETIHVHLFGNFQKRNGKLMYKTDLLVLLS